MTFVGSRIAGHMRATTSQFQLRAVPASGVRYLPPSLPGKRNPAPLRYEQFWTSILVLRASFASLHIDSEPVSSGSPGTRMPRV